MLIRINKSIIFALILLGLFACRPAQTDNNAIEPSPQEAPKTQEPNQSAPLQPNDRGVLESALKAQYAGLDIERLIVLDHTYAFDDPEQLSADMNYLRRELGDSIDEGTIQAFLENNQQSQALENPPEIAIPVELVSEEQFAEFFKEAGEAGWDAFFEAYPGSPGIIRVSRAGIGPNEEQALIYVEDRAAQDSAQGLYIFLVKSDANWIVERTLVAWVS